MIQSKSIQRSLQIAQRASRASRAQRRCYRSSNSSRVAVASRSIQSKRATGFLFSITIGGVCLCALGYPTNLNAESVPSPAEVKFEKPRKQATSKEDNRDLISSQHLQVKKSWENPGVYAWGSNAGRVVAPDSQEAFIKTPRRMSYFDGKIIRDIKLDKGFGAAISENGDMLQWGTTYSPTSTGPAITLRGKDLIKITISRDRIIALGSNGTVYSIPAIQADQISGPKPLENTWLPLWKSRSPISYRELQLGNMSWGEKVSHVKSGLEHCLILTSKGRVFSAASGTEDFPTKGQLGIPGLTWTTRPSGHYDQPHEISTLKGFEIERIATGDYHSLALDNQGRVFTFGDNSAGQLGFDPDSESSCIDAPSLLPIDKLYKGTNLRPRVTNVAAGGSNSFFTVDATRIAGQGESDPQGLGRITVDTWSCGQGILGGLGNGRWTHVQGTPTKIKALSGLFEYDEIKNVVIPIRLANLSVGATHAAATMSNVVHLGANNRSSKNDTNWGADVLWWGGNEYYQLGTGKRNNISNPVYIPPMDIQADREKGRREEHRFQITPRQKIKFGGKNVSVEQRIECGRGVTAVYSGT
ncbi:regulator of chromosome condensation 1/beta-lactamase-inhibitor protein II [Amylocarpus encephaloides]|uniref:Regulator of chromosome condensation 1/beta-lactamase-inhibitor protein II n=1 Tax=Amylocarpus encephaloides TaxID=45428 RepID=A0A9P8C1Y6_9HELO|nr:regulator of chromosome condensation 1/beta-lactamase-inhibitor protein II [Amylocarpus encephaloides]